MRISSTTITALRQLASSESVTLTVAGDCMTPVLGSGDRIAVRGRRLYLPGDIVAFHRTDRRLLVHRVLGYTLGRSGISIMARGDHLSREDEPVSLDRVVGRVVGRDGSSVPVSWRKRAGCTLEFFRTLLKRSIRPWASATSS